MPSNSKSAKQAEAMRISQVGDFKKRIQTVLELPSGLIVKVRNPGGLRAFLDKGTIPNSLMPLIQKSLNKGKAVDVETDLMGADGNIDTEMMTEMFDMMDNIAVKCMVSPKLYPKLTDKDVEAWNKKYPEDQAETVDDIRQDDRLYADELPDDDKQFIFSWMSTGVKDLETFRLQRQSGVDAVATVAGPEGNPE